MPTPEPLSLADALDAALSRVGHRWALLVVNALLDGPQRFNQLQARLPGVATNVLAQRLRQLEAEGVVVAEAYQDRPRRYAYQLTASGQELAGALRLLAQWGGAVGAEHDRCGTPLEAHWYCPTCELVVGEDQAETLRYL